MMIIARVYRARLLWPWGIYWIRQSRNGKITLHLLPRLVEVVFRFGDQKMTNASFSYHQHWFTISPIKDLEPNKVNTFVFLRDLVVVWKPYFSTQYSVFIHECPHCRKTLKTGHIDDQTGDLVCSYRGCRFDTQGICTHNPYAEDPKFIADNRYKKKLFRDITVLQTHEENGLLVGFSPLGLLVTQHVERLD